MKQRETKKKTTCEGSAQHSLDKTAFLPASAVPLVTPFANCSRVARAMTCLRAWRSEVPREIWRFQLLAHQGDDVSGSLTPLHERCSTWVKCGCTLSCKVAPRGGKVVGLRMTCAGLSCLTLDVFFVAYRGASASIYKRRMPVCFSCNIRSVERVVRAARHVHAGGSVA